jgi:brefeldin A-inhibited guanine nucleotide-exchange protein
VVVDVMEGYTNFPQDSFAKHVETFYPLALDLLTRDLNPEVRLALLSLLRKVGEVNLSIAPPETPLETPVSPFSTSRRYSRGR